MYCSSCGTRLEATHAFCFHCGRPVHPERVSPWGVPRVLSRPLWDKKIAGVCAGFARYLSLDVTLVRIVWLVTALFTGIGFIAYLIAWIAMPAEPKMLLPNLPNARPTPGPPTPRPNHTAATRPADSPADGDIATPGLGAVL